MTSTMTGLLVALLACAGCAQHDDEAQPAVAPIAVYVAPPQRGVIASILAVSGETVALRAMRVGSPVAGRVTELRAVVGDSIPANAVAARVLPIESEAAMHGLDVLRDAGALGADERPMAERQQRELARRDIPLRVPFDAIVADRTRNPGEYVAANDVLLEVFDPRSLEVTAQVPIDAAKTVRAGQRVEIRTGDSSARGSVIAIAMAVTPQSLTVPVRVALETPLDPPLLHTAVECRITLAEHRDALLIPRDALLSTDGADKATVMVAEDGRAVRRTVRSGLRDAEHVEIVDGLDAGDLVVVEGGLGLPDGAAIVPQTASAS
jgi:hypothetical protein